MNEKQTEPGWHSLSHHVEGDWVDYNGHMNVAFYVRAFDLATDQLLDRIGLGEAYAREAGCSFFVLEAHITYEAEILEKEPFDIFTQIRDHDRSKLHFYHEMYHGRTGARLSCHELLGVHVDLTTRKSAGFPENAVMELEAIRREFLGRDQPDGTGRIIGIRRDRKRTG